MNDLESAREAINAIDREMAELYQKRMMAARKVAEYKTEHGLPVFDPAREAQVIARNVSRVDENLQEMYEEFLRHLMNQSKDYQRSIINRDVVAYAGIEGAFAHSTSRRLFPAGNLVAKPGFEDVVRAVADRQAQYGVIPFENTNAGLVGEVMDLLYRYPVSIVSVWDQKIEQCLLGTKDATLKDIERVVSKDVALEQCAEFLDSLDVERIPWTNTAMAAKYVASQNDPKLAAVAARENALLYDLKVLAGHIEPSNSNTTRFLVIAREPSREKHHHMGLLLSVKNEVGALAACIEILSRYRLNMSSLQSRPIKERPFEYFFFIQCSADLDTIDLDALFRELQPHTIMLRNLGSYEIEGSESE